MSLPLIVHSKLFFFYRGQKHACWYLGWGDDTSLAKQDAYLADMDKFGIDTITLNLMNEELSSPFTGEFMASTLNNRKVDLMLNFIRRLKARGKKVVIVFFDCPRSYPAKYPFWKFTNSLGPFLEVATRALAPLVDGFILAIESNRGPTITVNRGLSLAEVETAIALIRQYAFRISGDVRHNLPVGTHEQSMRIPANADFIGYETRNHPHNGDNVSVADMVNEVKALVARANGKPVWIIESNSSESSRAREQNRAMAALPGVAGIGGPL